MSNIWEYLIIDDDVVYSSIPDMEIDYHIFSNSSDNRNTCTPVDCEVKLVVI